MVPFRDALSHSDFPLTPNLVNYWISPAMNFWNIPFQVLVSLSNIVNLVRYKGYKAW
jgi:hypothetical protein